MIYLDSAATSFYRPKEVGLAVSRAVDTMGNGNRGAYGAALETGRVIFETRGLLAELFNAGGPERVAFTANSTESLNIAIKGILNPGDHAVATVLDHNSVLRPLYEMEEQGVSVSITGCDKKGRLDYEQLYNAINANTRALICTHASNLTGNLVDILRIGKLCREKNIVFIADISQTAGIFSVDMERDNIDVLCFSGHKGLMGPQGTGGICVRDGIAVRPLITGGSGFATFDRRHPDKMPSLLEAGTLNGHGIAGLNAALKYIKNVGIDSIRQKEQQLAQKFYLSVKDIKNIKIYGDFKSFERAPNVALNIGELDSGWVCDRLAEKYDICTRAGGHCAPLMHKALGTEKQGAVRFSFSHFNTMDDVNSAAEALKKISEQV
ncbi:MAG: aminotransferase class V-fold PLP-dependent enzyme [Bacillota bacterium]|nr:aminotransferase class V-fold PLP-dependent enzyme [Bacillota bacterium]